MSSETVRKLYITLRRSFAGTRETQCRTLESLGLRYREQTVVQNNTESVRGAILKVKDDFILWSVAVECHHGVSHAKTLHGTSSDVLSRCGILSLLRLTKPLRHARRLRLLPEPCGLPSECCTAPPRATISSPAP